MDIYRFFHPHHNPRLHNTPIRQQELGELEHAASELRKAIERAQQRVARRPVPGISVEHFTNILKAMRYVEASMQSVSDLHPGDSLSVLSDLIHERSELSGWEAWTSLLGQQIAMSGEAERL